MHDFSIEAFFLLQLFVILFIFLSNSLNLVVFLGQYRKSILLEVFYLLFESPLDVLAVSFVDLSLWQKLFNLSLLFLHSLVCKLFLFFDKFDFMIILIDGRLVFHWPLDIESFEFFVFLSFFSFQSHLKVVYFSRHLEQGLLFFSDFLRNIIITLI